jgi:hypothetical protein
MKTTKVILGSAVLAGMMLMATGCGGSSSSSDDETVLEESSETTTLSGAVADGYLVGAKVCLDMNFNEQCDPEETPVITDGTGRYQFTVTTMAANAYTILADANESTVDLDTGEAIGQTWRFKTTAALGGFISPLTTMAVSEMELNASLSADAAKERIRETLGLAAGTDIAADYIQSVNTTTHTAAQIIARNMASVADSLTQAASNGDPRLIQLRSAQQVRAQLGSIGDAAKQGADYTVTADTTDVSGQLEDVNTTLSSVLDDAAKAKLKYMWEEEKMARDLYTALNTQWDVKIFENIAASEQKHMESVEAVMVRYGVSMEGLSDRAGEFQDSNLQTLYTSLLQQGMGSQAEAYAVGVTVEETDISDLEALLETDILPANAETVIGNLLEASKNHLNAFRKHQ